MADTVHMGELMCIMVISVTNGAWMVSLKLKIIPKLRGRWGFCAGGLALLLFGGLGCWPPP